MIYLNNAATSYPKPSCVIEAVQACLLSTPSSQFRGGLEIKKKNIELQCKEKLGELLHIKDHENIYFSSGATESLNLVFEGILPYIDQADILVTQTEHNSVLRPLLNKYHHNVLTIPCTKYGEVTESEFRKTITKNTKILIVNHCSNVTGMVQDMEMFGGLAKEYGLIFIADISQSAGCISVNIDKWGADAVVFTGHKSLLGIQGIGGYYVNPKINFKPAKYGGTGRNSAQLTYENNDYEYEVGTQNIPGITGLCAGVGYILERGMDQIMEYENMLMKRLYDGLKKIKGITIYGDHEKCKGPVLSMNFDKLQPSDAAYIFENVYEIILRTGLHCSPLIHDALGTAKGGTIRISVSCMTKEEEIDIFLNAVAQISGAI